MLFLAAFLVLTAAHALPDLSTTTFQDEAFLELRDAVRKQDSAKAEQLARTLSDYPVPSYVEYYRLKSRLETASETEILGYISRYPNTAIADRLRNDWLLLLGKNGQWSTFDREYPLFQLKDDFQLRCYAMISRALKGEDVTADARRLLDVPRKNNDGCYALISTLKQNGRFNADDLWFQVRTAAEGSPVAFVKRLGILAGAQPAEVSRALEVPATVLSKGPGSGQAARQVFILALGQLAKKDHQQAADSLRGVEAQLTPSEQKAAWAQIALPASISLAPAALSYWKSADGAPLSSHAQEWRVRMALRSHDWESLDAWIDNMSDRLMNDVTWVYWKGRARQSLGDNAEARRYFASIADQYSFYGQLALEELGKKITIPGMAKPVTEAEVAPMAQNAGFQLALKFFSMNMRFEGIREWNWQLRNMNDRQLLAVAEFAKRSGVLDRMVNTSDRTREEVNFAQRFPMPFKDNMKIATKELGLDMSWAYGLIRQESRFVMHARSSAGASGLMQLMPATARLVAKKIGFVDYTASQINSLETNILLGTNYLKMMMDELDNSETLATAGYNAGPGRPRAWRNRLTRTVEGAIFAETIPFNETRDYVKKVMSNATYYAALTEGRPQSLKKRMGKVSPP
ncbi:lytic transglycosylase domain-containing protein [Oxalobacter sp. OttesenSCG-928-P03]|nr:lytic transglycosylase domain-containing protein [Oxalobacter sp. OttesenSCG-928-P03]